MPFIGFYGDDVLSSGSDVVALLMAPASELEDQLIESLANISLENPILQRHHLVGFFDGWLANTFEDVTNQIETTLNPFISSSEMPLCRG